MPDVNDLVQQRIADARRRREAQQERRDAIASTRKRGLAARHAQKLAHIRGSEQHGARLAQAALRRDTQGLALALASVPTEEVRRSAAVALGALAELALTASAGNQAATREALAEMERGQPDAPPPAA